METAKSVTFTLLSFNSLTASQLYDILRLRSEVFVVEQNCVYLDMDNKDQQSFHLLGQLDGKLVAYTRLLPPGISYAEPSIGRVVTSPSARGAGYGRILMQESIEECYRLFGRQPIQIGAQLYLEKFYNSLGFQRVGDIYDEDGIDHIHMVLVRR